MNLLLKVQLIALLCRDLRREDRKNGQKDGPWIQVYPMTRNSCYVNYVRDVDVMHRIQGPNIKDIHCVSHALMTMAAPLVL